MRFSYLAKSTKHSVVPHGGIRTRYYPVIAVGTFYAAGLAMVDGLVDSGASDTVFPLRVARLLGIDLTNAPTGEAALVGGVVLTYRYALVKLRLSDGKETCEWETLVGFLDVPMRWALLGQTGFFEFFGVDLRTNQRELFITPNSPFQGTHVIH